MLARCITAENRKLHGSPIWLVFFIIPLFPAIMGTYNYMQNTGILSHGWYDLWTQHTLFYALFFFAPMVALYAAYMWRLEYLGNNENLIFTAPVRRFDLFLAKFIIIVKMVILTQIWVYILFAAFGHFWAGLEGFPPTELLLWMSRGIIGAAVIVALQLIISMIVRSFAAPVMIALAGGIAGMLFSAKGLDLLFPYSLLLSGMNSNRTEDMLAGKMALFFISCTVFLAIFFMIANLLLTRRDTAA